MIVLTTYLVIAGIVWVVCMCHGLYYCIQYPSLCYMAYGRIIAVSLFWPVLLVILVNRAIR